MMSSALGAPFRTPLPTAKLRQRQTAAVVGAAIILGVLLLFILQVQVADFPASLPSLTVAAAPRSRWSVTSTLPRGAWCDALMRDPRPADAECKPRTPDNCPAGVAPRFFSQYGQDHWLYTQHFRHLARPGVFVDLATNHPIYISNTYFLESCLGWSGLCVEPNSAYHERIVAWRSCELTPLCVAREAKSVEFIEAGGLSGIADTNKNVGGRGAWQAGVATAPRRNITCAPLSAMLHRRGITEVDFMSLDIEGAEPEALQSIDWGAVTIKVIALEDEAADHGPRRFLEARGYRAIRYRPRTKELMMLHPSVVLGKPT